MARNGDGLVWLLPVALVGTAATAAALEAVVAQGPSAGAQAALLQGTRDPDRNVRLAVAELAARQPTGAGVLRTLLRDQDPGVRARAAASRRPCSNDAAATPLFTATPVSSVVRWWAARLSTAPCRR